MTTNRCCGGLRPVHPGEVPREDVSPALAKAKVEIARLLGVSRQHLYDNLEEEKPVTPATALRLGKLLGNGPEPWIDPAAQLRPGGRREGTGRRPRAHSNPAGDGLAPHPATQAALACSVMTRCFKAADIVGCC